MHTQVHLKLLIMMEIQSITNVVSIHKSITSLTHLIDHSYCQAWSALLTTSATYTYIYVYVYIYMYIRGLRCYCMCLNNLQCMMTSSNLNIFRVTGPSCGEFTGHWSPVNPPHKGLWREALLFSLICSWINGWVIIVRLVIWDTIALIMTSL